LEINISKQICWRAKYENKLVVLPRNESVEMDINR
jgi:hypothetical protein